MSLLDVHTRSRFTIALASCAIACLAACGGTPHAPAAPAAPGPRAADAHRDTGARPAAPTPDPDLNRPPPRKLLSIDWRATQLSSEADALAVWAQIAPTGADWEEKLDEVPAHAVRPLAVAMLRGGGFTCAPPPPAGECARPPHDVPEPAPTAGAGDPCLRRLLALWSIAQLEASDLPKVGDALRAIAAIPPPESQLVAAALGAIPAWDQVQLLALIEIASRAGQEDVVHAEIGRLSEANLIEAATRLHIASALEVLSAHGHRATYLAAAVDEALPARARTMAISELLEADVDDAAAGRLAPDLRAALVKATASRDCEVAAAAARALELRGDRKYVPVRPRARATEARAPEVMMRALCVLASYEPLLPPGEPSLLATYVPPKGLERVLVEYDALSDVDADGDGDPHTRRSVDLIPRGEVTVPEPDDLARAMKRCTGTTCKSVDREFHFTFRPAAGELRLSRIDIVERPPCP